MILFLPFYRLKGIRNINQLMSPVINDLVDFELPMSSMVHWCDYEGINYGPSNNDIMFNNRTKPIQVYHELELKGNLGLPKKIAYIPVQDIRDYHMKNKRTRWLKILDAMIKDNQSLLVYNYTPLTKTTRYVRSYFTEYYKWYNIFDTMIQDISQLTNTYNRNHFFTVNIPNIIPSLQQLNLASEKGLNSSLFKVFRNKDSYLFLELWMWLHPDEVIRKKSLFSKIDKTKLPLVNLIFMEGSKWSVLNLGYLYSFSDASVDTPSVYEITKQKVNNFQLQKRFLKYIMVLMGIRTVAINELNKIEADKEEAKTGAAIQTSVPNQVSNSVTVSTTSPQTSAPTVFNNVNEDPEDPEDVSDNDTDDAFDDADIEIPTEPIINNELPELDDLSNTKAKYDYNDGDLSDETEAEALKRIQEEDLLLDEELAQLNEIASRQETGPVVTNNKPTIKNITESKSVRKLEDAIIETCDKLVDDGLLTAPEYKRFMNISKAYKDIPLPGDTTGKKLYEFAKIEPEEIKLPDIVALPDKETVLDKSMLASSLNKFDSEYIKKVMKKDVFNMVLDVQNAGIAVTDYKVETFEDALGKYETHAVKLKPIIGKESTVRFKLPVVDEDGIYESNGVKYRLRKQKGDLPIRKIKENEVALTSYYGKTFLTRGRKRNTDYGYWLLSQVMAMALDKDDNTVTNMVSSNVFYNDAKLPRSYTAISKQLKSFDVRGFSLNFDYRSREKLYPIETIKRLEEDGAVIIGMDNTGKFLTLDDNNTVYITDKNETTVYGTIEQFLNIPSKDSPIEYVEIGVFGKSIPVGVVLSYYMGFDNLLNLLNVTPRRVITGARLNLSYNEWTIQFSDETLVFNKDDRLASLILGGFNSYHKAIKAFSVYSFDSKGVYVNLMESNGLSVRYLREIDLMNKMFIDPITRDILLEMKEPVTYQGLLFRAAELLLNDNHPDQLDPKYMRIKGYERLSGAVYTEMIQAIRSHDSRLGKSTTSIELNPYAVWKRISEDPSKSIVNEINPIESLKEVEAVTFAGTGGRNKRSMTKATREYHKNDMGVISESTVDSSDVGINMFMVPNPQFKSLRGISKELDFDKNGPASLVSTSALLAVASNHDDPKRTNFIAIQNSHFVSCVGYHQSTCRTGYESVIPERTRDLFAFTAKKKGIVQDINADGIIVVYEDGEVTGYELGKRFGSAAGLTIPHQIVTPLKKGEHVDVGTVIVYNTGFFEPDFFNPKQIALKNSLNVRTVLWESYQTLEDASSMSSRISAKLNTEITKVKNIIVAFDQSVSNLVTKGQEVDADTLLCIIEDSVTSDNKLFDTKSIDTLRLLSAQSPRSGVKGIIDKVEVFYHGDKEDMSDSLKLLVTQYDKDLAKRLKNLNRPVMTGSVDSGMRIEGEPLGLDNVVIKVYITTNYNSNDGDKVVLGNQMKTVCSEVTDKDYVTVDGDPIDFIFGAQSINDRIVSSPYIIGTTNSLLEVIAKKAIEIYEG